MKITNRIMTAAISAVCAALGLAAFATEATLLTGDGYSQDPALQTSGLTAAGHWSIPDNFPNPAIDYRNANLQLRTPATGSSYVFGGKSLIIGSIADRTDGDYSVCSRLEDQEVTFENDGLILERGKLANQNPLCGIFKGKVTLLNTAVDGFYLQAHQATPSYAHMDFQCPFIGAAGTKLTVASRPVYNTGGNATTTKYVFSGDLSEFEGAMTVVPIKNSKNDWFGTNVVVGVKVASCPGSMDFYQETTLSLDDPATDFSLATLRFRKGSSLSFAADPTTGKPACLTVTAYTQDDVVALEFPDFPSAILADTTADHCFSLVKVPDSTPLDEKRFALPDSILLNVCPYWRLRVDTEGGYNILKLYANGSKTVTLDADAGYNNEGFPGDSKGKGAWSDGGPVASGKEYYNVGHRLRPDPTPSQIQPFDGDSLTLANGAELHLKAWGVHFNSPRILAETGNVTILQYGANAGGGEGWEEYAARSFGGVSKNCNVAFMTGDPLFVHTGAGRFIDFKMSSHRAIIVKNELVGKASLELMYLQEGTSEAATYEDGATLVLDNLNTNFTGTIRLLGPSYTTKPNRIMPSFDRCATLYLTDPRNLGGSLPTWTFDALRLEDYARLCPTNSMTLDDPTRGIYLAMGTPSQFEVREGLTFAIKERITYNGILYKTGAGTLAVGSGLSPKFGYGAAYDDPTDSHVAAHGLTIAEGAFKPLDDVSTDGLEVVFTNGTTLAIDASADLTQGVGKYGMRLVKNGSSLSVPEGKARIAIANDSGANGKADFFLPVCTVASAATAESYKAFFSVPRTKICFGPKEYVPGALSVRDNGDGTHTLGVVLKSIGGLSIIFK